jgi:hypothetical protein
MIANATPSRIPYDPPKGTLACPECGSECVPYFKKPSHTETNRCQGG